MLFNLDVSFFLSFFFLVNFMASSKCSYLIIIIIIIICLHTNIVLEGFLSNTKYFSKESMNYFKSWFLMVAGENILPLGMSCS